MQRTRADLERTSRHGSVERNCLDCGWKPRAAFKSVIRTETKGGREYSYTAWASRCRRCYSAHESARKAAKYAIDHPAMDPGRGRPAINRPGSPYKQPPCILAQVWRGIPQEKAAPSESGDMMGESA